MLVLHILLLVLHIHEIEVRKKYTKDSAKDYLQLQLKGGLQEHRNDTTHISLVPGVSGSRKWVRTEPCESSGRQSCRTQKDKASG